jgi:hypothetical protein
MLIGYNPFSLVLMVIPWQVAAAITLFVYGIFKMVNARKHFMIKQAVSIP